jgi:hypothetical protein
MTALLLVVLLSSGIAGAGAEHPATLLANGSVLVDTQLGSTLAEQVDQQQTQPGDWHILGDLIPQAQTFTAGMTGALDKISLFTGRAGTITADLAVQIQSVDQLGFPSGTVLASGSIPPSAVPLISPPPQGQADRSSSPSCVQ